MGFGGKDKKNTDNTPQPQAPKPHFVGMAEGAPGIVTSSDWIICPNGDSYKAVWCPKWMIMTDEQMSAEIGGKFVSNDRYMLVGCNATGDAIVFLPGSQAKGFFRCDSVPPRQGIYILDKTPC